MKKWAAAAASRAAKGPAGVEARSAPPDLHFFMSLFILARAYISTSSIRSCKRARQFLFIFPSLLKIAAPSAPTSNVQENAGKRIRVNEDTPFLWSPTFWGKTTIFVEAELVLATVGK